MLSSSKAHDKATSCAHKRCGDIGDQSVCELTTCASTKPLSGATLRKISPSNDSRINRVVHKVDVSAHYAFVTQSTIADSSYDICPVSWLESGLDGLTADSISTNSTIPGIPNPVLPAKFLTVEPRIDTLRCTSSDSFPHSLGSGKISASMFDKSWHG
jgi:hypothetical protein